VWRVVGLYRKAYVVTQGNLDPTARAANAALIAAASQPHRTVVAEDTSVKTKHPLAIELEVDLSVIHDEADAQAVVDHLLDLLGVQRAIYRCRARLTPGIASLLDREEAADIVLNRFGLAAGRTHTLTGLQDISFTADGVSAVRELDFWG